MKALDKDLLQEMANRLVAEFNLDQVILFGSHVWGVAKEYSA